MVVCFLVRADCIMMDVRALWMVELFEDVVDFLRAVVLNG